MLCNERNRLLFLVGHVGEFTEPVVFFTLHWIYDRAPEISPVISLSVIAHIKFESKIAARKNRLAHYSLVAHDPWSDGEN
jgi:hypothetical protein